MEDMLTIVSTLYSGKLLNCRSYRKLFNPMTIDLSNVFTNTGYFGFLVVVGFYKINNKLALWNNQVTFGFSVMTLINGDITI